MTRCMCCILYRNVQKVLDRLGGEPEQLQVFGAVATEPSTAQQDSYDCPVCFMDGPADTCFSAACGHKVCSKSLIHPDTWAERAVSCIPISIPISSHSRLNIIAPSSRKQSCSKQSVSGVCAGWLSAKYPI